MFTCDSCGSCCRNLDKSDLYSQLDRGDGTCKYLSENLCTIYDERPLLCRVDECYDKYFYHLMDKEEYYRVNEVECKKLKNIEENKMPLPLILGIGAAIAGVTGVGTGIRGAVKMKDANDTMKFSDSRHRANIEKFERESMSASKSMDYLGELELQILKGFDDFSNTIEKIQNRPQFKVYNKDGITLPKYDKEELKNVAVGAGVILGGLGGAAVGTAGGFAAAGATTSAVMALGTASTGTAIATLSGAAATGSTLAAIGGGALTAGGGGMALGATILGATTLGVGLLVGGVIFGVTGGKISDKADKAYIQMKEAEETIDKACIYLSKLERTANVYSNSLERVRDKYVESFNYISYIVNKQNKIDWNEFSDEEKLATENSVLLVGLLYKMCKVSLVNKAEKEDEMSEVNITEVKYNVDQSEEILGNIA